MTLANKEGFMAITEAKSVEDFEENTEATCATCGTKVFEKLVELNDYNIVRCLSCDLIFVDPIPSFEHDSFHELSSDFYYTAQQLEIDQEKKNWSEKEFLLQSKVWSELIPASREKTLLDVGCGSGLYVHAANKHGWKSTGCDIDKELVDLGNSKLNVELHHADLLQCRYASNSFDVVRLKFVLEHLPNPFEILSEVHRILKPGGLVFIVVPNEEGTINQFHLSMGRRKNGRWGTLTPPHHLHAFSPSTLKGLLLRSSLRPIIKTSSPLNDTYRLFYRRVWLRRLVLGVPFKIAEILGQGSSLIGYGIKPEK